MDTHYKRGVPPQIKRKERYQLRKHYDEWYSALVVQYGEQCANCGRSADEADLVLDHIQSIARGGTSRPDNLQILCEECNRIKHKLCIDCREWQSD
jgi:5-methylcytosine-specific restriction endonuclease McrA